MGIFSSSYKYNAYAASSALFEEGDQPDTFKSSLIEAATGVGLTMADTVWHTINMDYNARCKKLVRYARKEYVRKLPTSNLNTLIVDDSLIKDSIEGTIGEPLDALIWVRSGVLDEAFLVSKHIKNVYLNTDYFPWSQGNPSDSQWDEEKEFVEIPVIDPTTGNYYITENAPVFNRFIEGGGIDYDDLQDLDPEEYAQLDYFQQWDGKYKIGYNYTDSNGQPATWEMVPILDLSQYNTGDWLLARYAASSTPDETDYWTYLNGSGFDPTLEAGITEAETENEFFPVALLMQDQVWFDEQPESELAITTNKLLDRLALDGTEIKEDYLAQKEEDNQSGDGGKSNAKEWDFMIHFACPIRSTNRGSLEYMYAFFIEMAAQQKHTYEEYQTYLASRLDKRNGYGLPQPVSELIITESGVNGYNVKYGWSYIEVIELPGQFIVEGEPLKKKKVHSIFYERLEDNDAEYRVGLDEIHGTVPALGKYKDPEKEKTHKNGYHDYGIFTRQFYDADTNTYTHTRVLIMGLSMQYTINTRDTDEGKKGYRFRYADPNLFGLDEETKEFRIPIHIGILKDVPILHREEVLGDSLVATVFLVDKIKVAWYQTGFFKWLIIVVAVILIVIAIFFPYLIPLVIEGIAGLLGLSAIGVFILTTLVWFAIGYIITLAGSLIGGTAGMIFSVIGMIAMAIASYGTSTGTTIGGGWGQAINLVNSVSPYLLAAQTVYNHYALAELQADMRDFVKTAKEKAQELQDAWDSLGDMPSWLDPMDLIRIQRDVSLYEQPDTFYQRTLNMNPGLLGYDMVNNFSEIALSLPEGDRINFIEAMFNDMEQQRGQV